MWTLKLKLLLLSLASLPLMHVLARAAAWLLVAAFIYLQHLSFVSIRAGWELLPELGAWYSNLVLGKVLWFAWWNSPDLCTPCIRYGLECVVCGG